MPKILSNTPSWQASLATMAKSLSKHNVTAPWSLSKMKGLDYEFGDEEINPHMKKYNVTESDEDLLALSAAWHRIRKTPFDPNRVSPKITSLTDASLFNFVTDEDRTKAADIRDYYSKKIVVWTLKEIRLTSYRTDLNKFIHGNGKIFTDEMLPLAYRLPEFYEYDLAFADMMRDLPRHSNESIRNSITEKHTLRPLRNFDVKNKHGYRHEYWFKDENDYPVLILLEHINSCKSMFEREFRKESTDMTLTGHIRLLDDYTYFKVTSWKVE